MKLSKTDSEIFEIQKEAYRHDVMSHAMAFGLECFICLMTYQLFIGYLMPKFD